MGRGGGPGLGSGRSSCAASTMLLMLLPTSNDVALCHLTTLVLHAWPKNAKNVEYKNVQFQLVVVMAASSDEEEDLLVRNVLLLFFL